ncbi:MAG: sigma-E factor negative regulatory protein [Gammaproteobacteria bacterium]|nr:sigma-E factor negative regulatory protein [Gammaproteobacteria bacterium]NNJ80194.1 sigma-E factor negative regulatory protein [Xanthomonadales bacterium]
MTKEIREHVSSLMDGEIDRDTSRFLVRRLGTDDELGAAWTRYHMVRDCLRDPEGGLASSGLSARISRAIDEEEPPTVRRVATGWLKPFAGVAIAASVALMAVLAVGPGGTPGQALPEGGVVENTVEPFNSPQGIPATPVTTQAASNASVDRYLLRHYQATGSNSARGLVGFVPLVVARKAPTAEEAEADRQAESAARSTESPDSQ